MFRNRERGALHHPEFTMLEWYRADETYQTLMDDCAALLAEAARAAGAQGSVSRQDADPFAAPERLTVADAFARYAGIDLLATVEGGRGNRDVLAAAAARGRRGHRRRRYLGRHFQPGPGRAGRAAARHGRATILYEYPLPQAALARAKPGSDKVAERFELYACGVELANGFGELTDVAEQRARFETAMAEKSASMASAIRWTRISPRIGGTCRRQAELRSVSTGW